MACLEEKFEQLSTEETSCDVLMDPTGEDGSEDSLDCVHWEGDSDDDYSDPEERARDYRKYYQQLAASDGFDVDYFPKINTLMGMTIPLDNVDTDPHLHELSGFAIRSYNEENGTNYEVVGVTKTTAYNCSGFVYNITLKAEDAVAGTGNDIFRASVYEAIFGSRECISCELQPKPAPEPSLSKVDFTEKECQEKDVEA
ncbi:hypothetical protein LguiA_036531 [Lonicera macranthoides]